MSKAPAGPATAGQESKQNRSTERRQLVVGEGITLKADIEHCEELTVRGQLESSLRSQRVEVVHGGVLKGRIDTDHAVIEGKLEGTLTVRTMLILKRNGHLSGKVRYKRLEIEDGGTIAGDVGPLGEGADEATAPAS
ncbi:MAG: polymer-forming cytoskeletal protein [Acetobacterales bacterium]